MTKQERDIKPNLYPEMNDEIVKILRISESPPQHYAAAYIEHLRAENERMKKYEDTCHDCPLVCVKDEYIAAIERADRAERERDAATEQIKDILLFGDADICDFCKYNTPNQTECKTCAIQKLLETCTNFEGIGFHIDIDTVNWCWCGIQEKQS